MKINERMKIESLVSINDIFDFVMRSELCEEGKIVGGAGSGVGED